MVKNNETVLPLEQITSSFLSGDPTRLELSESILQRVFVDNNLSYTESLAEARRILQSSIVRIGRYVINISTENEAPVSDLMLFLIVRYVNVCHHGRLPIVVNGEVVFKPVLMEGFSQDSVLTYIGKNLMS